MMLRTTRLFLHCTIVGCAGYVIIHMLLFHERTVYVGFTEVTSERTYNGVQRPRRTTASASLSSIIVVNTTGSFSERINQFNAFLIRWRKTDVNPPKLTEWEWPKTPLITVSSENDDYIQQLSRFPQVKTFLLPWIDNGHAKTKVQTENSLDYEPNIVVRNYYQWTADEGLCSWIESGGDVVTMLLHPSSRNFTKCSRNINDSLVPVTLDRQFLLSAPKIRLPVQSDWNTQPAAVSQDNPTHVFLMHVYRNAIVTQLGDIISGNLLLVQKDCTRQKLNSTSSEIDQYLTPHNVSARIQIYEEVLVIPRIWGLGYTMYQRLIELVPRFVVLRKFLRENPRVQITTTEKHFHLSRLLRLLRLKPGTLVRGPLRAKIVYQPRSADCVVASVQETQLASAVYRHQIAHSYPKLRRDRVIVVRSSTDRTFSQQQEIEAVVEQVAKDYRLQYVVFPDTPVPRMIHMMKNFSSAVAVVVPHGASESNMIFSAPGTFVIEGVCNPPFVDLGYMHLASVLGHRWHGIMSSDGCQQFVNVSAEKVGTILRNYLKIWSTERTDS